MIKVEITDVIQLLNIDNVISSIIAIVCII